MNIFRLVWEIYKAWRRKEKKLKGVHHGRCFVKKNTSTGGSHKVAATAVAKLVKVKITRADGSVEYRDVGE